MDFGFDFKFLVIVISLFVLSFTGVSELTKSESSGSVACAVTWEMSTREAAINARQEGIEAAELATQQVRRIIGPIVFSGWDYFKALYYGGTVTEGFLTGSGTLFGAYGGGFISEQRLGRFGYLAGNYLDSWVGGKIGLMVYDVVNGVHFLLNFLEVEEESKVHENAAYVENVASYYPLLRSSYFRQL